MFCSCIRGQWYRADQRACLAWLGRDVSPVPTDGHSRRRGSWVVTAGLAGGAPQAQAAPTCHIRAVEMRRGDCFVILFMYLCHWRTGTRSQITACTYIRVIICTRVAVSLWIKTGRGHPRTGCWASESGYWTRDLAHGKQTCYHACICEMSLKFEPWKRHLPTYDYLQPGWALPLAKWDVKF